MGTFVQVGMQLLLVSPDDLIGRFYPRIKRSRIEWFRVLLVATHGPGRHQCGFGLAVHQHLNRPAVILFVFDDPSGPAIILPQARFLNHSRRIVLAAARSSPLKSGCAIEISASQRWRAVLPRNWATPCSVTT